MTNTSSQWRFWLLLVAPAFAVESGVLLWMKETTYWLLVTTVLLLVLSTVLTHHAKAQTPQVGWDSTPVRQSMPNKMRSYSVRTFLQSRRFTAPRAHASPASSSCSTLHAGEFVLPKNTLIPMPNDFGCLRVGSGFMLTHPHMKSSCEDEYAILHTMCGEDVRILINKVARCKYCGSKIDLKKDHCKQCGAPVKEKQ